MGKKKGSPKSKQKPAQPNKTEEAKSSTMFDIVDASMDFAKQEEGVLKYWEEINAFEESVKRSEGRKEYTFYDGPPFATGLPHYGHILAGTIKDVVTRYAHQTGHHVSRRFGWDCHGLPVEFEIDKKLGIKGSEDVLKLGIKNYNAECRRIVQRYAGEWEKTVMRMGRWIDFRNDYKTLNMSFMESVWWVFQQMFKKKLVYQGFKVMPYSTVCNTPLSNFEAGQNYKDVKEPSLVANFPLVTDKDTCLVAWTTTPWTLPSNLALCVNETFDYVKVEDAKSGKKYILSEGRLEQLYPAKQVKKLKTKPYKVVQKMKGKDLVGLQYVPLFDYFQQEHKNKEIDAWRVISDGYVTNDSGTGIVHQAPAFGEDDYRCCLAGGIIRRGGSLPCPVDDNGRFTDRVTDFKGVHVKKCDREIIRYLTKAGRMVQETLYEHSYPHCWRSDSPLIYKAVPSWFVNVPSIKDKLLANNDKTYWVPKFVQEKRFHNWLRDARDWAVSRNRYWGTPLPIWVSEDNEEVVCIGSVKELEELSGVRGITDLHRDSIDHITIPSKQGKGVLRRVPEVFDCWFESGSMPYAQQHYPFENKELFENGFPADFIAEGLDQTRGWFYTLMVISTALFDKPAFKNLVVNGLVLAADGKKMSKRLKNYPDPTLVVNACGADALRIYLINSPVVRAEPLRFQQEGVRAVVRDVFIPWHNMYRLFVAQARKMHLGGNAFKPDANVHKSTTNTMDKWILSSLQTLIKGVKTEMQAYHLYNVIPFLLKFVDQLSKWYVRLNKGRLKGDTGVKDRQVCLATLYHCMMAACQLMAPFTPFLVESMYQNLKKALPRSQQEDSVHYLMVPNPDDSAVDEAIERRVGVMQRIVELGRQARDKCPFSFRTPVPTVTIVCGDKQVLDDARALEGYIQTELNARSVTLTDQIGDFIRLTVVPDRRKLGKRLGKSMSAAYKLLCALSHSKVAELKASGKITISVEGQDHVINLDEVALKQEFTGDLSKFMAQSNGNIVLTVPMQVDEDCLAEAQAREAMSRVQQLRKEAALTGEEKIRAWYACKGGQAAKLSGIIQAKAAFILAGIRTEMRPLADMPKDAKHIATKEDDLNGVAFTVTLTTA